MRMKITMMTIMISVKMIIINDDNDADFISGDIVDNITL